LTLPLAIEIRKSAKKTLDSLDAPTRRRIKEKIEAVAADPWNPTNSKPLENSLKRSARVGGYRILVEIKDPYLLVSAIGSRNQIYRET
jgi:mRNA-degrading endonuclease RelE of RelBE toxin-antitoxin system